jgi:hypothetical protein
MSSFLHRIPRSTALWSQWAADEQLPQAVLLSFGKLVDALDVTQRDYE